MGEVIRIPYSLSIWIKMPQASELTQRESMKSRKRLSSRRPVEPLRRIGSKDLRHLCEEHKTVEYNLRVLSTEPYGNQLTHLAAVL